MPNVSAVIITRNEERNIERCLRSLSWAGEIILVDSHSTDNTVSIAEKFNCRIISTDWLGYAKTKQLGVDQANSKWIFWIDADEEVTPELQAAIRSCNFSADAYEIPRKTFFLGKWIKHCGWYPGYVKRLFNRETCRFGEQVLHEDIVMPQGSKPARINADLLHFSYTNLRQYFAKMNDYGKDGALELHRKGRKFKHSQLVISPFWNFIRHYFIKRGFLDGTEGFIISVGSAYSSFIKYTNFYYLSRGKEHLLR
jgi:(heptosyl)LPS beta-1,4-glucosyltransferase